MGKKGARSRPWTISFLTDLNGLTTDQTRHLENVHVRAQLVPISDGAKVVVFTTTQPYWAQTAHAAVGRVLRNIWSCDITEIHRSVTAINASEVEHLKEDVSGTCTA
jgi:hypothetical protein